MIVPRLAVLVSVALAAGCATATTPGAEGGPDAMTLGDRVDGGPGPDPADAGSTLVTLTQSASTTIVDANSVACPDSFFGTTVENHYYRVFDLAAAGAAGGFTTTRVGFGLEIADAQDAEIVIHALDGASLRLADLRELARVPVAIPAVGAGGQIVEVDVAAEAGPDETLVVELDAPDNFALLYVGSNAAGETGPTYLRAPDCDLAEPTPATEVLTSGAMHWVLSVAGVAR